jgi:hypothetical protein
LELLRSAPTPLLWLKTPKLLLLGKNNNMPMQFLVRIKFEDDYIYLIHLNIL